MKNLKSLISMLLCVVLLLGVMGAGALAAAEDPAEIIDAAVNENQLTAEAVTEEAAVNAVESAESEEVQAAPETGKKESKLKSVFRSELCGSHQGCQVPFRPPIPNVGLLLRRCSGKGLHLAMEIGRAHV